MCTVDYHDFKEDWLIKRTHSNPPMLNIEIKGNRLGGRTGTEGNNGFGEERMRGYTGMQRIRTCSST